MADELPTDWDKIRVEAGGGWAGGTGDWITSFGRSAVESIPELVGISPSDETVRWRAANPWTGFASEMAGMAVPYGGWMRAARGIKALEAMATGLRATEVGTAAGEAAWTARALEAPFMTAAKAEAVRLAPFEIGRVLASQAIGDQPLSDMAVGAGMNLALGAGLMGGIGKLGAMGKTAPPLRDIVPGLNEALPGQLVLRKLDELLPQMPDVAPRIPELELRVRGEEAPKGTQHVDPSVDPKGQLEKLFTPGAGDDGFRESKKLVTGGNSTKEFMQEEDWHEAVRAVGIEPKDAPRLMQFPRVVSFNPEKEIQLAASLGLDVSGPPSVPKGYVRFYHGGDDPTSGGSRWVTTDPEYAKNFRTAGTPKNVHYVDVPKGHPFEVSARAWDDLDAGTNAVGLYNHAEVPEEVAKKFKPLTAASYELTRTKEAAAFAERAVMNNLKRVGDGWMAAREGADGMYVMAKKIAGEMAGETSPKDQFRIDGKIGRKTAYRQFNTEEAAQKWMKENPQFKLTGSNWKKTAGGTLKQNASPDDKWVIFKTDQPGQFVKNSQAYMNTEVARNRWIVGANALEKYEKSEGLLGDILRLRSLFPREHYTDVAAAAGSPGNLSKYLTKVMPKALRNNEATQHGVNFIRTFVAPAEKQFTKAPRASWMMNQAKMVQEGVESFYQKMLQGEKSFKGSRAIFSKIVPVEGGARSVEAIWNDADKDGVLNELLRLHRQGIDVAGAQRMAADGVLQPRTVELASELRALRELEHKHLNAAEEINGATLSKLRPDDYGLPRVWEGDFQVAVRDEGGKLIGVGAGGSAKGAKANAEALAKQLGAETKRLHRTAESFHKNQDAAGLPKDIKMLLQDPGKMLQNRNIRGFKWDLTTPTVDEVLTEYKNAFSGRGRAMGTHIREATLAQDLAALTVEDPASAKIAVLRLNQMAGKESEFSRAQNKLVDRALGPIFGANNATKIVSAFNTGMAHLQLGAFKLSYPLQNLVGVVQTVAPELAFVLNSKNETLSSLYHTHSPAMGSRGSVGMISTLAPMKILGQAVKMAWKPSAGERALLERALNERVLDARVAEDFIGQNRKTLTGFKGALNSPKAFAEFGLALSEWMPVHSERFARVVSFNAGVKVAKDVLRLADDEAYLFAKRFVERTNYMYGASDRPLMFTTPIGSALGLFKTWQMNYIYTMAQYAHLGFDKGVWSPLMWQTLGTAALGGAAATPLYWAADGASHFFKDKSLIQYAYDDWQGQADGIMFGLPAALTGVSLSGLMTSPGASPVKDATQLFSIASWSRMKEAGGAVKAAMDNWQATGSHPASDPDVRNALIKAFAPVIIQRMMATDDEGTIRNIATGLPTAKGLSFYDRIAYQAGLQPVAIERQMAATDALYRDREKMKAATKAFGDALADAWRSGDSRGADVILQRMIAQGVDVSGAMRSAVGQGRNEQKTSAERLARPAALAEWTNVRGF